MAHVQMQYGLTYIININVVARITTQIQMLDQEFMAREGIGGLAQMEKQYYFVIQMFYTETC